MSRRVVQLPFKIAQLFEKPGVIRIVIHLFGNPEKNITYFDISENYGLPDTCSLSDRLQELEAAGILRTSIGIGDSRSQIPHHRRPNIYRLTQLGRQCFRVYAEKYGIHLLT